MLQKAEFLKILKTFEPSLTHVFLQFCSIHLLLYLNYAYYEIAKKYGLDLAQMSLKFLEIQPFVTSVIIGATTMEQLKTNIESVNIKLSDDVIKEINNVQTIYPNPCP